MSNKNKIIKEIHALEEEIKMLEIKRSRSLAALMESVISRTSPNETDVQFFRTYTAEIDLKREQLQKLTRQLEDI